MPPPAPAVSPSPRERPPCTPKLSLHVHGCSPPSPQQSLTLSVSVGAPRHPLPPAVSVDGAESLGERSRPASAAPRPAHPTQRKVLTVRPRHRATELPLRPRSAPPRAWTAPGLSVCPAAGAGLPPRAVWRHVLCEHGRAHVCSRPCSVPRRGPAPDHGAPLSAVPCRVAAGPSRPAARSARSPVPPDLPHGRHGHRSSSRVLCPERLA